jgi:hypothetical protein
MRGLISIMAKFLLILCQPRVLFAVFYHGAFRILAADVAYSTTTPGLHPPRPASLCFLSDAGCMCNGEGRMTMVRFHTVLRAKSGCRIRLPASD